jgi:D-beta-D-heptose 7-phosphate kinase / D-beta-D-heptose 1-phosphate adenosyltransferase
MSRNVSRQVSNLAHAGSDLRLPPLKPLRVLAAGEVILDRYLWGDVSRISPEAPIPVLQVHRREEKPGNAGFVMANLRALGATVTALSVVGADRNGTMLREIFSDLGIDTTSILTDPDRPTIVKERMLGSVQSANRATQQLLRVDDEDPRPLEPKLERAFRSRLKQDLKRADGVLVSDIDKGLMTPALLRDLIDGSRARKIPIVIDPRMTKDFAIYKGATAITPNRYESELATGIRLTDRDAWREAAETMVDKFDLQACLITLDRDGMYLAARGHAGVYIPTAPREVYDVTGAGDIVLTVFGLFVIAGLSFPTAATIANLAAGIEVSRHGAELITPEDLQRALGQQHDRYGGKILSIEELGPALDRERKTGRRIVFTNGCFDLLHAGHVQLLSFARSQGDVLVVGVNSDRSVRELKGKGRPVYSAAERTRILAALEAVSYVAVFDDRRAEGIVRAVKPDVLVKGEDWRGKTVDGGEFVESRGGRVVLAPILDGHSTSTTISRLNGHSGKGKTAHSASDPKDRSHAKA